VALREPRPGEKQCAEAHATLGEKGWLTEEEAQQRLLTMQEARTDLPWLNLRSLSTGQSFKLFIRHGDLLSTPVSGMFTTYGLSATATVPWF
jgi:CRISPR-associated endonuclease Csy4